MTIETAPPMAHAVGGSLGSALALLLLYPLERARVEMQTIAANNNEIDNEADEGDDNTTATTTMTKAAASPAVVVDGTTTTTSDPALSEDIHNDKVHPLLLPRPQQLQQTTTRGGGGGILAEEESENVIGNDNNNNIISASVSEEESWESCRHRPDSVGDITSSSSSSSSDQQEADIATSTTTTFNAAAPPIEQQQEQQQPPAAAAAAAAATTTKREPKNKQLPGLLQCIYHLHQRKQLYKGVAPVVTTMAASNFVFFYMHSFLKQWLVKLVATTTTSSNHPKLQTATSLRVSLLASTLAGICNVLLTNPMWVANLRIVTNKNDGNDSNNSNNNLFQEMKSIAAKEGWAHLWNGTPASLLLVSNPVIQFVAYEQLKNRLLQSLAGRRQQQDNSNAEVALAAALRPLEAFVIGAIAKAISTVLTYPLQLTQTVLRVQKQEQQQEEEEEKEKEEKGQQLLQEDHPTTKATTTALLSSSSPKTQTTQQTTSTSATTTLGSPSSISAKQQQQKQQQQQQQLYRGTMDCLIKIYQQKGLEGWFAGMKTKLLQTVLTAAFTFLTYEQIIRAIMAVHRALQEGRRGGGGGIRSPNPIGRTGGSGGAPVP